MSLEFMINEKELILVYTPFYGIEQILEKINFSEGYNIKNTFWIEKEDLRQLNDFDEESISICIGIVGNEYIEMNSNIIGTNHRFFFSKDIKLNQKMFIANQNVAVLKKIDQVVDGDVYIGGERINVGYYIPRNVYIDLINMFPNSLELTKYVHKRIASLIKEFIPHCDKYEYIYERYIEKKEKGYVEKHGFQIIDVSNKIQLEQFRVALNELKDLLDEAEYISESIWQQRIEKILHLLYPQYILNIRELSFSGVDGYDKRPDFILVDVNGFIDIMEIKKPTVNILTKQASYRNNHVPVREFSGAVQQIEKYIFCLISLNGVQRNNFFSKLSKMLPKGVAPQIVNPKGILLLGRSNEFNEQQIRDFELIKRQYNNIADIMTYDDLVLRFEKIIDSLSNRI